MSQLQYKAYLNAGPKGNHPKEIRRFAIDTDVTSSYDYLVKKISSVFPNLSDASFTLQWKDEENDMVAFSSDDELMQALTQVNDGVMKIYITENSSDSEGEESDRNEKKFRRGRCGGQGAWFQHPPRFGAPPPPHCRPGQYPHAPPPPPPFAHGAAWGMPFWDANFQQYGQQQQQQSASSNGQGGPSTSNTDGQKSQQSQENAGETYLQSVGQAVAGMLRPFGIDVDIDIENNKGKRTKCKKGGKNKKKQQQEEEKDETVRKDAEMQVDPPQQQPEKQQQQPETKETPTPSQKPSEENGWTVVQDSGPTPSSQSDEPTSAPEMEQETVPVDLDPRLIEPLNQMLAMGFNNDDGWLSNLLIKYEYSIPSVLEDMQRKTRGDHFRA